MKCATLFGGCLGKLSLACCAAVIAASAAAETPQELISAYAAQARAADGDFSGFSAERGQSFYARKHAQEDGSEYACASCHHEDPRREQFAHHDQIPCRACHFPAEAYTERHKIRRQLLPLAPVTNPARFNDAHRVEIWFERNCAFVLGRACTAQEKGDLLTWLLSLPEL